MRLLVTISMALLLGCQKSPSYDTYIQVEPAANPGHIFVMAIVERVPQAENKPDNGMGTFVLKAGSQETQVWKNKNYPNRDYQFVGKAYETSPSAIAVEVTTSIKEGDRLIYTTKQRIYVYKVF